ncbi:MAG: BamA/TamA family outer membrane protein [Aquificae bacterium]|nr:BamA/TamA family outer membrane protein [Aquificota bacterium]
MRIILLIFLIFVFFSDGYSLNIVSNYPLPKNNIKQVYEEIKDKNLLITLLKKTNDFEKIDFKDETLILWKKPVIKQINVIGNKSFWKSEIIGVAGIIEKHPLDINSFKNIPMRLKQFYIDNGFLEAKINLETNINLDGFAVIKLHIKEGKIFKLNKILFLSERKIPEKKKKKYKRVLKLNKKTILKYQYILERLEVLSQYLKKEGFFENIVTLQDIRKISKSRADLYINISFGTKYQVIFKGIKNFEEKELKKFLTFVDTGVSVFQLNKTKENIEKFYIDNGFLDAKVKIKLHTIDDFNTQIIIYIDEGKRYILQKIEGNFKSKSLAKFVGKPYKKLTIKKILDSYIQSLIDKGFLRASYHIEEKINRETTEVTLFIDLIKGKKFILEKIEIKNYKIKKLPKLPTAYNGKLLLELQEKFAKLLKDNGYFDADVLLDVKILEKEEYFSVIGIFNFKTGERYRNGTVLIYGTYHLFPQIIKLNLDDSRYFSKEKIDLDLINLYSTYLFDYINPYTFIEKNNKRVDRVLSLHEDKRGFFQGSIGYNTDRQFRLQASLILKNLFNYGFESFIYTEFTNLGSSIYKYSIGNRLIPKRISGFLSIYKSLEIHRIYDLDTSGLEFALSKLFTRRIKGNLTFRSTTNNIKNETVPITVESYKANKVIGLLNLDYRVPKYDPMKGYINISKLEKNFKDITFWKAENLFRYFYPVKKFVFSQRYGLGYIFENVENVPLSERFFLGGLATVRGFGYEEIKGKNGDGGIAYAFLNNDLKYPLYKPFNIYLLLFLDLGNVFVDNQDIQKFYLRKSTGIGLLIPTPVGSIVFDVARKLDKKDGESLYRFELSIGITF